MDLYAEVMHHLGHENEVYAWAGERVFLWFYEEDGEEDDQKDDAVHLQGDVPCSCWVRL